MRFLVFAAGIIGFLGIVAHAYEAHSLAALGASEVRTHAFAAAADMLTVHGLALLALAALGAHMPRLAGIAGLFFFAGALVFALPLTAYALLDVRQAMFAAPVGGLLLLAGWLTIALGGVGLFGGKRSENDPA